MKNNIYDCLGERVRKDFIESLGGEGIIFDSGSIWITFSTDYVKGPGFLNMAAIKKTKGRLIITEKRLIALIRSFKIIDIIKTSEDFKKLNFDRIAGKRFEIFIDYSKFPGDVSGSVKLSYSINPAQVPQF